MRAIIDTSAWIWAERHPADPAAAELALALDTGVAATCAAVKLEILRGAGAASEFDAVAARLGGLAEAVIDDRVCTLAGRIQRALAALPGSRHRPTPAIDLLVAAAAIVADMAIVHRDRHFETIAEVTRQPIRWLGPA